MITGLYVALIVLTIIASSIRILQEFERGVIFTLGRFTGVKGPGIILVIPMVQKMEKMDLRTVVLLSLIHI